MRRFSIMLFSVGVLALMVAAAAASPGGGPPAGPPGLDRAIEAQERHTDDLLAIPGVVGTAVGLGPNNNNGAVVFVFTEREGVRNIPARLDGVQVVPHVTGKLVALHHRPGHDGGPGGGGNGGDDGDDGGSEPAPSCSRTEECPRPVPIGVSTGHPDITAGTIGARVTDGVGVYALSNNHVYAVSNSAEIGDTVLQPGRFDGGDVDNPDHHLGTLYDFEPIDFDGGDNIMDAAIALSATTTLGNRTLSGWAPSSSPVAAQINQRVMKYGRTTGETDGRVWAVNATVNVSFGDAGVARFVNQIVVRGGGFSAGGDSGSLVVTNNASKNPMGLLFAGSSSTTIINPIGPILTRFGVEVDGN